ncbi:MAG: cob(I)yrinic acid a,c-diamide adenosyltransferase [Proteobacteria bacterium]|nr:cob(I)yrinic acid a,c-diamide adenosyltransferase [Pseudomonadota bacterium]
MGFTQLYTGNGKGKTTAALGLALRATGWNKRIVIVQFMKKWDYGEVRAIKKLNNIELYQTGTENFVDIENPSEIDIQEAQKGLDIARKYIKRETDILILDEIVVAAYFKLIKYEDIYNLIDNRNPTTELILTGRGATKELIERCDLVTEMKEIKHYYEKGIDARKGIEF